MVLRFLKHWTAGLNRKAALDYTAAEFGCDPRTVERALHRDHLRSTDKK
jgi:hypothetical protein